MPGSDPQPQWHHAPLHIFVPNTIYMVTGGTLHKEHFYRAHDRLRDFEQIFFEVIQSRGWELRAWALFSNHYHFIAKSPEESSPVGRLIQHLHSDASRALNEADRTSGRQVWYQYWDRCLTFEKSYYPRLNYVIHNPVKHGLVAVAADYPFCSAGWFERHCRPAFQKKVKSFRYDRLQVHDEFEPVWQDGV